MLPEPFPVCPVDCPIIILSARIYVVACDQRSSGHIHRERRGSRAKIQKTGSLLIIPATNTINEADFALKPEIRPTSAALLFCFLPQEQDLRDISTQQISASASTKEFLNASTLPCDVLS